MTDEEILNICILKNGNINNNVTTEKYLSNHIDIREYLKNRYNDIPEEMFTYKEVLWRIKNHIDKRPVCNVCKNPVSFIGKKSWDLNGKTKNGYLMYCSTKCSNGNIDVKTKVRSTIEKKYGVTTPLLNDAVRKKFTETMLRKYGVEHALKNEAIKEKAVNTIVKKYGTNVAAKSQIVKEKIKATNIKKYGFVAPACSEIVLSKIKDTNVKKYGAESFLKSEKFLALQKEKKTEWQNKALRTLIQTGKINKSVLEDKMWDLLCKIYGKENVIRQYKSNEYPFVCDFFVKSEKMYVEYQGTYFHNYKLYNEYRDKEEYELLKLKSIDEKHPSYKRIIDIWTKKDVEKYNVAKKNNIKIVFIYPDWSEKWKKLIRGSKKIFEKDIIEDLKNALSKLQDDKKQIIIGERI